MLHRSGVERAAGFLQQLPALLPIVAQHPDLDQFMASEIDVDFPEDGGGESGVADHDHRLQMMGAGAQRAPFRGCQNANVHDEPSLAYGAH